MNTIKRKLRQFGYPRFHRYRRIEVEMVGNYWMEGYSYQICATRYDGSKEYYSRPVGSGKHPTGWIIMRKNQKEWAHFKMDRSTRRKFRAAQDRSIPI